MIKGAINFLLYYLRVPQYILTSPALGKRKELPSKKKKERLLRAKIHCQNRKLSNQTQVNSIKMAPSIVVL